MKPVKFYIMPERTPEQELDCPPKWTPEEYVQKLRAEITAGQLDGYAAQGVSDKLKELDQRSETTA
jgi:hypothetical protein